MAYCDRCGAYIPDGQGKCLACGYDPDEEKKRAEQASAQAAAYAVQAEREAKAAEEQARREADARAEAERRRAERQEQDRVWAENERRRRKMEEEFRRAQEEKERRAESYVNRGRGTDISIGDSIRIRRDESGNVRVNIGGDNVDDRRFDEGSESREDPGFSVNIGGRRYSYGAGSADAEEPREYTRSRRASRSNNHGLAAISYIGILFFVPLLFGSDDEFVKFHARQGLKLFAYSTLASIITGFVGATPLVVLLGIALSIKGIMNVINGKMEELPLLNKLKWFS